MNTMSRINIVLVLGLLVAGCVGTHHCYTSEFFLNDSHGKRYGPYKPQHGDRIRIGEEDYTVHVPSVVFQKNEAVKKMKTIIIPSIDFKQAHIYDVIEFLQQYTPPELLPTSSVVDLSPQQSVASPLQQKDERVPLITFSAENISLFDALTVVCEVAGLKWEVEETWIRIRPKAESPTRASTRLQ